MVVFIISLLCLFFLVIVLCLSIFCTILHILWLIFMKVCMDITLRKLCQHLYIILGYNSQCNKPLL